MMLRRCQPAEVSALLTWTGDRHYLGYTPPGCACGLEVMDGATRVGALILGKPGGRGYESGGYQPATLLELTRMYLVDACPKNSESKVLAMMRKHVRMWMPQVRLLIAYSDPSQGHEGTIYEADGWAMLGKTKERSGAGWQNRPGRKAAQNQSKIRWVRTP